MANGVQTKLEIRTADSVNEISNLVNSISSLTNELKSAISAVNNLKQATLNNNDQMAKLNNVTQAAAKNLHTASKAAMETTDQFNKTKKSAEGSGSGISKFGEMLSLVSAKFVAIKQAVDVVLNAIKKVVSTIIDLTKKWFELSQKQSQYIEDLNFLNNAYGDVNNSGKELLDTLNDVVGYDPAKLTQTLAVYRQFGNALDMDNELASTLAENMLKLSLDVKSITGQDLDKVSSKFQSALAGNIRAVRAYGVDITQAALGQEALALGIDKSIGDMSRAEKTLLTYIVMQKQLSTANGDLSRTVNSVANQTEIFHSQIDALGRNIGAFFIPILRSVIPVLNGILMAINTVMQAIQSIFGITAEQYAGEQGVGGSDALEALYEQLENEGKAATKASKASKEAQKTLRGFDKLNVIKTPTKSGGSGSGSGVGGGIDKRLIDAFKKLGEYNMHLEEMNNWAVRIRETFLKLIDWEGIKKWIEDIKTEIDLLVKDMKESGLWDLLVITGKIIIAGEIRKVGEAIKILLGIIKARIATLRLFVRIWGKVHDAMDTVRKVILFLGYAAKRLWEEYIKPFIIDKYEKHIKPVLDTVKEKINDVKKTIAEKLQPVITTIKEKFDDFKNAIKGVVDWLKDHLFPETEEGERKFGKLKDALSPLADIVDTLKKAFHNLKVALDDIKKGNFDSAFNGLKSTFDKTLGKMGSAVGTLVENLKKLGDKNITSKAGSALQSMFNTANIGSGASDIIKAIIKKANGGIYNNGVWSPVKAYAGGGFPSRGEIFMARETKGPELVGKIGSSTAVLNNDQILEQMTIAVARGIAASGDKERPVQIIAEGDTEGLLNFINFKNASKNRQYGL